jgi:DNA-binding MarR family transcriptional regulator
MQLQISTSKLILEHEFARVRRVPEVVAPADPVEAWRALNAAHAAVHAALENELRKEHDLSTIEFEVLERLGCCSEGKVRMSELAEVVHATQSTVSRVVARLEDEGLVCRAMCSDDRRGIFASLSQAGRARVEAATPTYRRVIAAALPAR